ncbi:thiamine phosphate synthase [Pedobacter sp. MW01-1-1]|uniref:thiamine phosphate synthase n=1 Tax=Pedobacter sp. MW01-1-1 TaxID=3383027 RepID=UPI003FED8921
MLSFNHRLYLVTDEKACLGRDFFWVIEEALKGGVDLVQLREKELSADLFTAKAQRLLELCSRYSVPVIINDNVQVAKAVNAYGLHIGQSDMAMQQAQQILGNAYPIGLSIELPEQLENPEVNQAWYLGVSPIFSTQTKKDTIAEWGLEGLQKLRTKTAKPLVAIGNIKLYNAAEIIAHGADCLAVVSEICSAENPAKAAELIRNEIEKKI